MTEMLPAQQLGAASLEQVLIGGDLSNLSAADRVMYYKAVCDSVKLNPLTKPFEYITLNGKLTLYARRDATDQLRQLHKVSIEIVAREVVEDCYVVTARATTPIRQDESIGAVNIAGLKGDVRANAMMKAETKAKRRVTLSICGLGMLDETEVETIPGARITPSVGIEDRLTSEEITRADEIAAKMHEWLAPPHGSIGDAVYELENAALNAEQTIYLWTKFEATPRRLMKAEQARLRKSAMPDGLKKLAALPQETQTLAESLAPETISPAAHKRLEARISELKLDREAVKKYVKDTFGRDHFTEMTKEEYDKLDKTIEIRAAAKERKDKLAQPATEEEGGP